MAIADITGIPTRPIKWTMQVTRLDGSRETVVVKAIMRAEAELEALAAVKGAIQAEWIAGGPAGCCLADEDDCGQ